MVSVFKMAWRNVWRNKRRTLVTMGAMTLALFVEIHHTSLIKGYLANMESNILDLELGDIQIHSDGYRDDPSIYARIENPGGIIEALEAKGYRGSARLLGAGLGAAGDASSGVVFRGVDPARDEKVTSVGTHVDRGEWLDRGDPHGVVIGRKLARTLTVTTGDEIVVLTQGADGSMANDVFTVRGILKGVGEGMDRAGIYMLDTAFRELFVLPDGAHQIIVRIPEGVLLDDAAKTVAGLAPDQDVQTWKQLIPTLATMLESTRGLVMFIFFIFYVVVGIVVLNAMLMAVFERIREFGVLKALGVGPGSVLRLIYLESFFQVILAIVLALVVSTPLLWYLVTTGIDMGSLAGVSMMGMAMMSQWKAIVGPQTYVAPIVMLVFVVAIAVLYPAVKAALIRPVEAMRHQ